MPKVQITADQNLRDLVDSPEQMFLKLRELQVRLAELEMLNDKLLHTHAENEARLRTLVRTIPDLVWLKDLNGTYLACNRMFERFFGAKEEKIIGKTDYDFVDRELADFFREHDRKSMVAGIPTSNEEWITYKDNGQRALLETVKTPMCDSEGRLIGVLGIARDITGRVKAEEDRLKMELSLKIRSQFYGIVGSAASMQRVYSLIEALANVPTTVLILGESGTGKELVAAALHSSGKRSSGPFVKVNCSALSESLLESELFGHVRGAFTGAIADKVGRFQKADGGTLFLDEIGDISFTVQMRLLRVLQESEFERVGDSGPIKVDVRIIAATNMNLEEKVRQGMFRQDLYYRLNVIRLELPPLRNRLDDLHLLVTHFITRFNDKFDREIRGVSDNVMDVFRAHDWPGNIRELEHVIERAIILCTSNIISFNDLPDAVLHDPRHVTTATSALTYPSSETTRQPLTIEEALVKAGGNKTRAAKLMGISRWTLYRKL